MQGEESEGHSFKNNQPTWSQVTSLSELPVKPVTPLAATPGHHWAQSRSWGGPFLSGNARKDFSALQGNDEGEPVNVGDAQKPFPTHGEYPRPENTSRLQTPGSAKRNKTPRQWHSRTFPHAPAGKTSAGFHSSVGQLRKRGGGGGRHRAGEGRGALRKSPARLRGPAGASGVPRPQPRRNWAGLVVRTTLERLSAQLCLTFADGPPRLCFAQHGEQGKRGTQVKTRALISFTSVR